MQQRLALRLTQVFSCWKLRPWSMLRLAECLLPQPLPGAVSRCRQVATELLAEYNECTASGAEKHLLQAGPLRQWLARFADGEPMHTLLRKELLLWATGLSSMARLEARHHLVGRLIRSSPSSTPAVVSATLRLTRNKDLTDETFRLNIAAYMQEIHNLLPDAHQWVSRSEYLSVVYGCSAKQLHTMPVTETTMVQDLKQQLAQKRQLTVCRLSGSELSNCLEYIKARLQPGAFFGIRGEGNMHHIYQVVHVSPGNRKYIEKVCFLGCDARSLASH